MKASDIMTTPVITVNPGTPLHDVVELLLAHRISGVLVMEDDKVVGVIGDGDLLHRHEIGTDRWADRGHFRGTPHSTHPGAEGRAIAGVGDAGGPDAGIGDQRQLCDALGGSGCR